MSRTFDYPEIPPGVQSFDIRRFRRHHRKAAMLSQAQQLRDANRMAEAEKKAILKALHHEQEKVRGLREEKKAGFFGKVKKFFSRARKS